MLRLSLMGLIKFIHQFIIIIIVIIIIIIIKYFLCAVVLQVCI